MASTKNSKIHWLFLFMIILIFCLILEYVSLRSLPFIDCQYLSTSTTPNLSIKPLNITKLNYTYQNEINKYKLQQTLDNYTNQLQQQQLLIKQMKNTLIKNTEIITHYEAMNNPLSFEQWLKGVGNTKLSNEGFSDTCVIPKVAGFQLSESAAQHRDPFYSKIHNCND
eukprot:235378_1